VDARVEPGNADAEAEVSDITAMRAREIAAKYNALNTMLEAEIRAVVRAAVDHEREECAKVADSFDNETGGHPASIACAIRHRAALT
jgi:hypothetical protein